MKIGRRGFFGIMAAAPAAARHAAEQGARQLASIGSGSMFPTSSLRDTLSLDHADPPSGAQSNSSPANWKITRDLRDKLVRAALDTPVQRAELEAILYEENRYIHTLDPDLAANRSYSLAAKLCYQRQRLVQRAIEYSVQEKSPYRRINDWRDRILSLAGIKF